MNHFSSFVWLSTVQVGAIPFLVKEKSSGAE